VTGAFSDPLAMWREALSKLEANVNTISMTTMETEQFSKAINQVASASTNAMASLNVFMERYLAMMNLPSANQLKEIAARLGALESGFSELNRQLQDADRISRPPGIDQSPRPPRTRQAPSDSET
jgi:hypothetical protein